MEVRFRDVSPEVPLAYEPNIQEFYADAIGCVELLGTNFRTTLITYGMQGGVLVRIPVTKIVRPIRSLMGEGGLAKLLGIASMAH